METFLLIGVLLSILSSFIIYKFRHNNKVLSLPPSPPTLPIIGNLHQFGKLLHQSLWELSRDFGPVMLMHFGRKPTLIISSGDMAKQVLKTLDQSFCSRPHFIGAKRITYNYLDVGFAPNNDHWREMRRIFVTELVGPKRAHLFEAAREWEIEHLIRSLSSIPSNTAVNLDERLFDLITGITCSVTIGKGYRRGEFKGRKLKELFDEAMDMISGFSFGDMFPLFGWVIDYVTGWNTRLEKCFCDLDAFLEMVIDEHLDGASTSQERDTIHDDFIGTLIELSNDKSGPFQLTKEEMKAILLNTFLGGIDTTFVELVWTMSEILKNPRVMHKVQTEVRTCIGRKQKVKQDDVSKMSYLKMVVKESLRLHPAVPFLIPHKCIRHCKIAGYDVFPETTVMINAWGIGRDPGTWKNPDEFYPERFEEIDIDFVESFEMVPFGGGRRICPGLHIAKATVELTVANLLYWFDWGFPSGMKSEDVSMEEEGRIVVRKKSPLCVMPIKHYWQD